VPTVAEQGVSGFEHGMWYGVVAPAGIPLAVRASLVSALTYARQTAAMRQGIEVLHYEPIYDDPEQFAAAVRAEIEEYSGIANQARSAKSRGADR
jgi:tripartite-type tricarboxylate transporter receptor subunit TctC